MMMMRGEEGREQGKGCGGGCDENTHTVVTEISLHLSLRSADHRLLSSTSRQDKSQVSVSAGGK